MPENPYNRYRRILQEIADGAVDPASLAADALKSRKLPATGRWRAEAEERKIRAQKRRDERLAEAQAAYRNWRALGYPPIARFAKQSSMTTSAMRRLLQTADKKLPRDERRLDWHYRTRDYRPLAEVKRQEHIRCEVWEQSGIGQQSSDRIWRLVSDAITRAVEAARAQGINDEDWISAAIKILRQSEIWPAASASNAASMTSSARSS